MKFQITFFLGLALCLSSAHGNVFGADRREFAHPAEFPAVGRVYHRAGTRETTRSLCTGTLVHERFVLTAAHCIARIDSLNLNPAVPTMFELAQGFRARAVRVWSGEWEGELSPRDGDWAFLELEHPVPSELAEPLELLNDGVRNNAAVLLPGFSLDRRQGDQLSVDRVCRVRSVVNSSVFHHDCGAFAGASGGPILVKTSDGYGIVGIHNAHKSQGTQGLTLAAYSRSLANIGASVRAFQRAYRKIVPSPFGKMALNATGRLY